MDTNPPPAGVARFGQSATGDHVECVTLVGGGLTASVLTRGVTLHGLWPEAIGFSVTQACDNLRDYERAGGYPGALVGPVANRITGARATVDGKPCRFEANEAGQTTLHSGATGIHAQIWRLAEVWDASATFTLDLPDGLGGFPGNRRLTATYSLPGDGVLRLDVAATTDAPTLMNIANHSYWNLDGTPSWRGHSLKLAADYWLPVDDRQCPTGEIRAVADEMDFRQPRQIRVGSPALDMNFCLAARRRPLTEVATLVGRMGMTMQLSTTEPGLQVYDGRNPFRPDGGAYEGIALEPQGWPDAANHSGFPSILLQPGETYAQTSLWRFGWPRVGTDGKGH